MAERDWGALADRLDDMADFDDVDGIIGPNLRAAAEGLRLLARVTAERDRLRELAEFLIDACATARIAVPLNSSLLDLAADVAAGVSAEAGEEPT